MEEFWKQNASLCKELPEDLSAAASLKKPGLLF